MYSPAVIIGEKIPTGRTGPQRAADTCIYYTALQNVPKSSVDLNGPSQRLQFLYIHCCEKCMTGVIGNRFCAFNSHLSYHSATQVVRSFNVTESHCNLKSARDRKSVV